MIWFDGLVFIIIIIVTDVVIIIHVVLFVWCL